MVDQSIIVFGLVFPRVAQKHRLQMLDHFSEHIKQQSSKSAKNAPIAEAIQMNIFTAVLSSLKGLVEAKTKLAQEDVKKAAVTLIIGRTLFNRPILRNPSYLSRRWLSYHHFALGALSFSQNEQLPVRAKLFSKRVSFRKSS